VRAQEHGKNWPSLPAPLRKRAWKSFTSSTAHPSRLQRSVGKALGDLGIEAQLEQRIGEGYSIDMMVVTRDGSRIAIEVDGPSHFLTATHTPNGATQLKRRQLRNFGYEVVSLPFWEWQAINDADPELRRKRQQAYLATALQGFSP